MNASKETLECLAEGVIFHATRMAWYTARRDGKPSDTKVREAWDLAVQAQVRAWEMAGIADQVVTGGATMRASVSSTANQGASIAFDNTASDRAKAHLLSGGLAPEARAILAPTGLLGGFPGVWR